MRKHLLGLAITLAILIVAVSIWVVVDSFRDEEKSEIAPEKIAVETTVPVRSKTFSERMKNGAEFLALENFEAAESEFAAAAVLEPGAVEALLNLAETQIQLKELDKARANLDAAEQLDATNTDVLILRGIIFLRENNFLEAEQSFAKAGDAGNFWRGMLAAFFDRRDEAVKFLAKTSDARAPKILAAYSEYAGFPDSPKTHLDTLLSKSFIEVGEYQLALAKIGPVLEDDANYRDAWILTGYAQFAEQKFELARESWMTAHILDSGKPETQYFLGLVNFEMQNWEDAEKYFLLARENNFVASDLDEKLVEIYLTNGKYRAAAELMFEKIENDPNATVEDFSKTVSIYLDKLKNGRAAWSVAELATKRFPQSGESWNLAGWVSFENNYLDDAQSQLEKSIALDADSPWPYFNLGKVFEQGGKTASALAAYHESFDRDPTGSTGTLAAENYNRLLAEIKPPSDE